MGFLCACLAGAAVLHMGTNISWELVGSTKGNKTDYSNTALKLSACLFPVRNVDACKCMHWLYTELPSISEAAKDAKFLSLARSKGRTTYTFLL